MNVYQKLSAAREVFHTSKIKKTGHNKFAGYDYFELGDFIVPALHIFREVGLSGVVSYGKEEATLTITNMDKPDECIVITSPMSSAALKGCHEVQNLGAVQTYLRRYLWVAALEIVEHDALDATTGKDAPKKSVHRPVEGAVVPEDEKPYLNDLAEVIKAKIQVDNDTPAAVRMLQAEQLEAEQKTYFWSLLPSDVRSKIKTAERTPL
jgi:hypothetical protein